MNLSDRQNQAIAEASEDRREFANRVRKVLTLDDRTYPFDDGLVSELSCYSESEEPAVHLDSIIEARLPRSLETKRAGLVYIVHGEPVSRGGAGTVEIPGFYGRIRRLKQGRSTEVMCSTAGYRWQRTKATDEEEGIQYTNATPASVIYSALSRIREYEGRLDISAQIADEPLVSARGSERIQQYDSVKDMVALATQDPPLYRVFDTRGGVGSLYALGAVARDLDSVWEIEEGRDCEVGEVTVDSVDEEPVAVVAVYMATEAGQKTLAREEVDNGDREVDKDDIYPIEFTQEDAVAGRSPRAIARQEAARRALNAVHVEAPMRYWPIMVERGDIVGVTTLEYDVLEDGILGDLYTRYLVRVDADLAGPAPDEGKVSGEGMIESVRFEPAKVRASRTPEGAVAALYGMDYRARFRVSGALSFVDIVYDKNGRKLIRVNASQARRRGVVITEQNGYLKVPR